MSDISVEKGTFTKQVDFSLGTAINSAATIDLGASDGNTIIILGTTAITGLGTPPQAGVKRTVKFNDALTLTHSASLLLFGSANIITATGDYAEFTATSLTVWEMTAFFRGSAYTNGLLNANAIGNASITSLKLSDACVIPSKMPIRTEVDLNDIDEPLLAADLVNKGIFFSSPSANRSVTTDTATAIIALLPAYQVGTSFEFCVISNTAFNTRVYPGVGCTFVGDGSVIDKSATFLCRVDSPTTLTIYRKS